MSPAGAPLNVIGARPQEEEGRKGLRPPAGKWERWGRSVCGETKGNERVSGAALNSPSPHPHPPQAFYFSLNSDNS